MQTWSWSLLGALLSAGSAALPAVCQACAVCNDPTNQDSQAAFLNMTIFMSLFPLAMIGGVALWLWRRVKALEAQEAALDAAAAGHPAPPLTSDRG
jgi:hypothetical protein